MGPAWKDRYGDPIVWDGHGCLPLDADDLSVMPQVDRYAASGVDVVHLNIGYGEVPWEEHVATLAAFRAWFKDRSDRYEIVTDAASVSRIKAEGKLAIAFDIEGGAGLGDRIDMVDLFYDLGVRWMLIAYNKANSLGSGVHVDDEGLTDFGRRVIDRMATVGMLTCVTHTGYRTAREAIDANPNPTIFSHSNARAVHDHPRNVPDDLIRAMADRGGVMGVNGINLFLGPGDPTERLFAHVDHVAQTVGAQHVGIGLDTVFDLGDVTDLIAKAPETFPQGMGYDGGITCAGPEHIEPLTERMTKAGYADADVAGILGGNFMRLARAVWR